VAEDPTVARLVAEYGALEERYRAARSAATCELDGACGTGERGAGPVYERKQAEADELRARLSDVGRRLDAARAGAEAHARSGAEAARASAVQEVSDRRAELDRLRGLKRAEEDTVASAVRADTGLLASLDALSRLTAERSSLRTAYLVLLLFITTIEVLPVLVTVLTNTSEPTLYQRVQARVESTELAAAEAALEYERRAAERALRARLAGDRPERRHVRHRGAGWPAHRSRRPGRVGRAPGASAPSRVAGR
jgi:hypothetical protein